MLGIAANADKYAIPIPTQILTNARREMSASLADVTGITRKRGSRGTGSLTLNILPIL